MEIQAIAHNEYNSAYLLGQNDPNEKECLNTFRNNKD